MTKSYDIIIIGGGNAGFGVSTIAQDSGSSIAFIEERDFGGTCPNRGCTPKKVLAAATHALEEIDRAAALGIEVTAAKLDWAKLIQREKDMISFIPDAMENTARGRGDVYRGTARFTGPNSVEVDGQVLTGANIVIATGSRPRSLPISGADLMITSDEILSEETQPQDILFVGGGVIAMEFSHLYARAGTGVTILEAMPRLLPRADRDAVVVLEKESRRIGIEIETGAAVKTIQRDGKKLRVTYEVNGTTNTRLVDRVVNGTGRIANVEQLNLSKAQVEHEGVAIKTTPSLRSVSNPAIWVVGDALVSSPQLSPVATYEGRVVGQNIVNGADNSPDYAVVPSSVFTVPALAAVGLSEDEAKDQGRQIRVTATDMSGWFSAKSYAEPVAWAKIIVDQNTDHILGAHMVGHHGEDLIQIFALAMQHGITAGALKENHFAYPTFASDIKNLL